MDAKNQILKKTEKGLMESKKIIMAFTTLAAVILIYICSLVAIILMKGQSASEIVSLSNITIVFVGTLMSIALTGQSAVDWKAISSLESINKSEIESKVITEDVDIDNHTTIDESYTANINLKEFVKEEGVNAPEAKPFGQAAIDE